MDKQTRNDATTKRLEKSNDQKSLFHLLINLSLEGILILANYIKKNYIEKYKITFVPTLIFRIINSKNLKIAF